jgi:malic enzyme
VAAEIALAVATQAQKDGVAAKLGEDELRQQVTAAQWTPEYPSYYDER